MKEEKKYILKFNNLIYCNLTFDEINKILLNEEETESPLTNKLLLIEILKVLCIIENRTINILNSEDAIDPFNDFDYNLIINDNDSIIDIINCLEFAEIKSSIPKKR